MTARSCTKTQRLDQSSHERRAEIISSECVSKSQTRDRKPVSVEWLLTCFFVHDSLFPLQYRAANRGHILWSRLNSLLLLDSQSLTSFEKNCVSVPKFAYSSIFLLAETLNRFLSLIEKGSVLIEADTWVLELVEWLSVHVPYCWMEGLPSSLEDMIESIKIHIENTRSISVHRMRLSLDAVLPKAAWTRLSNTQLGLTAKIVVVVEYVKWWWCAGTRFCFKSERSYVQNNCRVLKQIRTPTIAVSLSPWRTILHIHPVVHRFPGTINHKLTPAYHHNSRMSPDTVVCL